ncbi:UNVERIFIED_CONTAM: putative late blight resistance proteinR1A-10 [Sesamum calycinum]|uniref:Late blight resistance proteinR1A-10 n=1 Tax=Sesamum calycinum TaxID=2727403 RepID=A0AAW2NEW1_9LAMI
MAVAAYASLISLIHFLDNVQHPARRHRLHLDIDRIQSLREKVQFLQDFLEVHSQRISQEVEDLARQITLVADDAEETIDLHVVDQLLEGSQDESHHLAVLSSFCQNIDKIIEKIDSITEDLLMIKEEWGNDVQEQNSAIFVPVSSKTLPSSGDDTTVGFEESLLQIMDVLTGDESNLQVVPIVGMGGIGKTTLARNAFNHPYIINRFDILAWITISQEYNMKEILLGLLNDASINGSAKIEKLQELFYQKLFGRKYLIVIDDIWSTKIWNNLRRFFPDNRNGSRILMTTRLTNVAVSLGSLKPYLMDFLDDAKSWNLLCEKVYGQKSCPYPELEGIGKNIANGCKGLPLALVVIGGLLSKSNMQPEYWMSVASNVNSFANSQDNEHCLKILSLSYNNLPIHLKSCFLGTRVFPEDHEINISKLINLWVAQGFIKAVRGKSLKEVAEEYLKDLVDRNLILIRRWTCSGKIKACIIHDLLRDLCLKEFERENLIRVSKVENIKFSIKYHGCVCFLCSHPYPSESIHLQPVLVGSRSATTARPRVCEACRIMNPNLIRLRWMKVINHVLGFPGENFPQHTGLRCLSIKASYRRWNTLAEVKFVYPSTVSLLWNLQILVVDLDYSCSHPLVLPFEIWEMPQLTHLSVGGFSLRDPQINRLERDDRTIILENLITLSTRTFRCSEEVIKRVPNLKNLRSSYSNGLVKDSYYSLCNLAQLNKLASLSLEYYSLSEGIAFPASLEKLTLSRCSIPSEEMTIIGSSLPNLEVLKLKNSTFQGAEWNLVEEEFLQLRVLSISGCKLVRWRAESNHFPKLERLLLEDMHDLEEIPSGIGDIPTLDSIHLNSCGNSVINSAKQILEEQLSFDNELEVLVNGEDIRQSGSFKASQEVDLKNKSSNKLRSKEFEMAVAAYAALLSLTHFLDNVQHPARRHRLHLDANRIRSLQEKVGFLQDFFEVHSQRKSQEMEDLARQISVVADDAEDIIDIHVVDQLREGSQDESHHLAALSSFCEDIDKVIEKIDSITKELMTIKEDWGDDVRKQKLITSLPASSSTGLPSNGKNSTMVGFDERLLQIMDELARDGPNLQILPIVGMGGFLNDGKEQESNEETVAELGEKLHKKLFGRKYLIVMDDVWSIKAWDDLNLYFPKSSNGNRVMMTTRLLNVVVSLGSREPYLMDFLDDGKSWNLLCEKVFGQKGCPYPELEGIGKDIAKGCKGLPLAIVVVAGLLAKSNMTREYWDSVAKNLNSFANSEDNEHCLKILSLSYNNLPIHLKLCFLYMGVFGEDKEIKVSKLARLWVAEGLLKPIRGKILEKVSEEYLKDLIDRNMILIRRRTSTGNIRSCGIHDLLRDLCLKEVDKEHFIRVLKVQRLNLKRNKDVCFLCSKEDTLERINLPQVHFGSQSTSIAIPFVCDACRLMFPQIIRQRLARVMRILTDDELLQPTKLRYLYVRTISRFGFHSPSSIHLCWNLQTLHVELSGSIDNPLFLPNEIWEMPQLRHIKVETMSLPDPIVTQGSTTILENLQTLSHILNFRCTPEVLERIPNVKRLKISYSDNMDEWPNYCLHNLAYLHKLESLRLLSSIVLLKDTAFPQSLKKLSLVRCRIPWKDMPVIGSLPNLEVLKLYHEAFQGPEWNPDEGQFLRLKVLCIHLTDLERWGAEDIHFPKLESLVLKTMFYLEEIPPGIGDIPTLRSIHLSDCTDSVVNSAKQIQKEQQSNGNELEVSVGNVLTRWRQAIQPFLSSRVRRYRQYRWGRGRGRG